MGGDKLEHTYRLNAEQIRWLQEMSRKYDLPDEDKALRCLIDYAIEEGDLDGMFKVERCLHC